MYPVFVLGLVLIVNAGRYAYDLEPMRVRLITALSITLLVFSIGGTLAALAKVFWYLEDPARFPADRFANILCEGVKEASRPCVTGFALLGFGLVLATIGVYRGGQRELRAARG